MSSTTERMSKLSPEKLALLKKAMGDSQRIAEPIAIVGMGCRFAGAKNTSQYWDVIQRQQDKTGEIPASRWDIDRFFTPTAGTPGKMTVRWGGFLDHIDCFDASFFGISPREAEKMDPQHRMLLQVVWEALEYGGIAPTSLRESATGVFVGIGATDYSRVPIQLDNYYEQITAYSGTGNALSIAANRISYTLDLRGPSLAIDTACSSSLVAAHLAVRSLRSNECDTAIVGGVNAILTPETTLAFSQAQMLSPDGRCRPFDNAANGYVRGEGCGVVILKRLSDAVSHGDMVLATIRGTAVNQDGLTSGITAPRGTAQVDVIRRALRDARCTPEDISYIEAHGTATPLGDPIELTALAEIFRTRDAEAARPCYLGSVKANIGHTETAAGIASLIKTVLMFQHATIPAQTHFQELNEHIDLDNTRLQIASEQRPWDHFAAKPIAGISSFGFGGTNSHIILEGSPAQAAASALRRDRSSPTTTSTDSSPLRSDRPRHLMTLSAKTAKQLNQMAARLNESIVAPNHYPLADACYTAAVGRTPFKHRLAISATDANDLKQSLDAFAEGETPKQVKFGAASGERRHKIAFLFPGQGAQAAGMGRELFQTHRVFREAIESCDEILAELLPKRLLHVLYHDESSAPLIHQTQYTQPALFAIEYAMSRLWRSFGIEPAVMLGHSIGDYVAACEAGVFSLEDGLKLIAHRGRLVQSLPADGSMAVVFAERDYVTDFILPYEQEVAIAAHNGPQSVVIAGRTPVIVDLLDQFESAGVKTRSLEVSHAMHSPLLDPILDQFEQFAGEVTYHAPKIPLISSRDGLKLDDRIKKPSYWRDHLRHTVCFVDATRTLEAFSIEAAIEVGPGTTLCGLAGRMWQSEPIAWLPSLRAGRQDWDVLNESVAELFVRGVNVDWKSYDAPFARTRVVLPTYPFDDQSHWYDMTRRQSRHVSPLGPEQSGVHPLVGSSVLMAGDKTIFEQPLSANHPQFLADHCLDQAPVVPAAAYVEQALALAQRLFENELDTHSLSNLSIDQPLVLTGESRRIVQLHVGPDLRGERSLEVYSRPDADESLAQSTSSRPAATAWTLHATATLRAAATSPTAPSTPQPKTLKRAEVLDRMSYRIDGETFYQRISQVGLQYGPMFQVLSELNSAGGECLGQLQLPAAVQNELTTYVFHPSVMDACLQSMAGVVIDPEDETFTDLILPTHVERVTVFRPLPAGPLWVHTRRTNAAEATDTCVADIDLYDDEGNHIAEISGARVQRVAKKQRTAGQRKPEDLLYEIRWTHAPLTTSEQSDSQPQQRWLVFADAGGLAEELATQLQQRGDDVSVVHSGADNGSEKQAAERPFPVYQIDPHQLTDYEQLLQQLSADAASPVTIVDLRGVLASDPATSAGHDQAALADSLCLGAMQLWRCLAKTTSIKIAATVLVTQGANAVVDSDDISPAQTSLWGMGRTAMVEMPHLSNRLIDLDPAQLSHASMDSLLAELDAPATAANESEDHVALRAGQRYVARLEPAADLLHLAPSQSRQSIPASERFSLRLGASSSFDELHYAPVGPTELGSHEVEIAVGSTGLNFSDVLKALGLYPGIKDEIVPLGIECAGVVSRIGAGVDRFHVGQRVMGVAPYAFASHTTTADYAIVATPENISDDEAATIPITFLTAHYALRSLARLGPGERVLIHAGAGGVGLAAIQIAQSVGAEIFATAGSDAKRDYLRSLGVEHLMDSRSLDFAAEILDITDGYGVDVVLNSLPGEAITKSLSILAAYGRFLEIGKTDIYQNRRIGLWPFQDNLSYHAIDLDRMLRQRPHEITRLYDEIGPLFEQAIYRPLPLTRFAPEAIVDAFRYMSQRKNIGKVVVSLADRDSQKPSASTPIDGQSAGPLTAEGTVLITGGLGALGLQIAQYAIAQGARHLAILTRRDPDTAAESLDPLRATGAQLTVLQGDVSSAESLATALQSLPSTYPPIRGVFHAAGVLRDGLMQTMDEDQLRSAMAPKTHGAWNLHHQLGDSLDFFVLFSSVAATIGSPGQANYAAGNAFLDGLASHRQRLGLPATSLAWGPWDAAGMAANADVRRQLVERGMVPLTPSLAIDLLDQTIRNQATQVAVLDVNWDVLLSKFHGGGSSLLRDLRSAEDANTQRQPGSGRDDQLFSQLKAADPHTRLTQLQAIVTAALSDVMGVKKDSIDQEEPLASLGLDSLMGMELRAKLEAKLGIEIPMASLFDEPSVLSLARVAAAAYDAAGENSAISNRSQGEPASRSNNTTHAAVASPRPDTRMRSDIVRLGGTEGSNTPLFCLHPVGGDLRCYDALARAFHDRPVYGLRAQGLRADSHPHATMDALVSDYTETIRSVCPEGPYCFVGWSTGGIFAYEIARRLHQEGLPVQSLLMIDTPLPLVFEKVDQSDEARFLVDLIEFANHFAGTSMEIEYEQLHRLSSEDATNEVLRLSIEHGVLPAKTTSEYLRRLVNVCKHHVNILQSYQTPPSDLTVEMLRPEATGLLAHATGQVLAEDLGWSEIVNLRLHQVPGHHFTMMTTPHVSTMAQKIGELLAEPSLPSA